MGGGPVKGGAGDEERLAGVRIRLLPPGDAETVAVAVEAAYGRAPAPIPADPDELAVRMSAGLLVPAAAEDRQGTLLAMIALRRRSRLDRMPVLACGVTMDEGADRPGVYAAVFRRLVDHARRKGWSGVFSEVTGTHAERRRINLQMGAHETGFQPGWLDQRGERAQRSVAMVYLPVDEGEESGAFVPTRHAEVVSQTVAAAQLGAELRQPGRHLRLDEGSKLEEEVDADGRRAFLWAEEPGANLVESAVRARDRLDAQGVTAVYLDLPLDDLVTAQAGEELRADGFAYAGLYPGRGSGLVLRLQSLGQARISAADAPAPSLTGRRLFDYVLADLVSTGHSIADPPAIVPGTGDDPDAGEGTPPLRVVPPLTGSADG